MSDLIADIGAWIVELAWTLIACIPQILGMILLVIALGAPILLASHLTGLHAPQKHD